MVDLIGIAPTTSSIATETVTPNDSKLEKRGIYK